MSYLDGPIALFDAAKEALANKVIDLVSNTLTGTTAQFNTANSDADFYTTGGTDVAVADGGTGVSTLTGIPKANGTSPFTAAAAGTDYVAPGGALGTPSSGVLTNCTGLPASSVLGLADELTTGEATVPRLFVNSNANTMTNGLARFTFFTARKSETITQVSTFSGSTAQVGATLCRIGIYSVDASDNLTLVASTANDTTLWVATTTEYVKSLSASFSKVRGTRYAVCELEVGTSTAGTLAGNIGPIAAIAAKVPRWSASLSSQTDLLSNISVGSLSTSNTVIYAALLP